MIKNNRYYWSSLKTKTVTVSVEPKARQLGVVFRVGNMIDLGTGRQTVMLEHVDHPKSSRKGNGVGSVNVPFRMGNLDFIYTSVQSPKIQNVSDLLSSLYRDEDIEKIITDVLSPGDILVFKQDRKTMTMEMMDTLRVVKANSYNKSKAHARYI